VVVIIDILILRLAQLIEELAVIIEADTAGEAALFIADGKVGHISRLPRQRDTGALFTVKHDRGVRGGPGIVGIDAEPAHPAGQEGELLLPVELKAGQGGVVALDDLFDFIALIGAFFELILRGVHDLLQLLVEEAAGEETDALEVVLGEEVKVDRGGRLEIGIAERHLLILAVDDAERHQRLIVGPRQAGGESRAQVGVGRDAVAEV